MFPDDVYIVDPFKNNLYKISDSVESKVGNTENGPRSVLVMQDQVHVLTANSCDNSVSVFRNGVREKDIEVGKMPWAICEDLNGSIYVACYGDSSVQKINAANWTVEATIQVSKGPRGIVADMDGNIWVACYLTNKLNKIVNTKVVQSVDTANNPCGITCDPMNNIWVTSYSSNIVSKITNGKKILDVETGQGPIDVVSTSEGTIYVIGYLDDSITMIENTGKGDLYGLEKSTFGTVNGPCSIGVDSQDNIYVTSELGTTVKKYKGKTEQAEFNPCGNPTGYGDMTGCATRNVINQKSKAYGVYTAPPDGWQMTDLSVTIQKLLQMVQDSNVNTSADLVSYDNQDSITNVEGALDSLFKRREESDNASNVVYNKNNQTTVESALDDLYSRNIDSTSVLYDNNSQRTVKGALDELFATRTAASTTYNNNSQRTVQGALDDLYSMHDTLDAGDVAYTNNDNTTVLGALDELYSMNIPATRIDYNRNSQTNVEGALSDIYTRLSKISLEGDASEVDYSNEAPGYEGVATVKDMLDKLEDNVTKNTTDIGSLEDRVEDIELSGGGGGAVSSIGADKVNYTKNGQTTAETAFDDVYTKLGQKADSSALANYATTEALTSGLAGKANTSAIADMLTKTEANSTYATKTELSDLDPTDIDYTNNEQTSVSGALDDLYNKVESLESASIDSLEASKVTYTKNSQANVDGALDDVYNKLGQKADTTTLEQYLKKEELATEIADVPIDSNDTTYTNNSQTTVSGALDNIYTTLGTVITDSNLADKVAELDIAANKVTYTKNSQTTVDGALDNIYTKLGEVGTTEDKKTTYYWTCSGMVEDNITPSVTIAEAGNITEVCASVDLKASQTTPGQDVTIKVQKAGTTEATFSDISTATVTIGSGDTTFVKTVSITEAVTVNERIRVSINVPASNNVEYVGVRVTETITTE